ncbi:uncharacterized protein [Spinacia oleracea]|uniref:Phytocyanin domain-containing protein n=1 Tax=Spinacia oleracea TaxID=3562 RepID=A0A9R0ILN0_SPIOL|nr:uncharacterized protein LOC110790872 [Spinacia oleracea]
MATMNSSLCILVLTLLGASLLETCIANKELEASTKQHWGWRWRRGWSGGRGQDTPPASTPWGQGWGWSGGRGQDTPPGGTPQGQGWGWRGGRGQDTPPASTPWGKGWGWGWGGGRGQDTPPASTSSGKGWGWGGRRGQDAPPASTPSGKGWGWGRGGRRSQDTPPTSTPEGQGWGWSWRRSQDTPPASTPKGQPEKGRSRGKGQDVPPAGTPQEQPRKGGWLAPAGTPKGQGGWPAPPAGYNFSRSGSGWPFSHKNRTRGPNKIVVGGSSNWNFGFNYTDWALKSGPFYINDVLVFKFNAPVNGAPGHSVYLLPDLRSYLKCDLSNATRIATTTQGGSKGFEFKLTKWQPHYFACGEHNGIHCNLGMMKFFVMPIFSYEN